MLLQFHVKLTQLATKLPEKLTQPKTDPVNDQPSRKTDPVQQKTDPAQPKTDPVQQKTDPAQQKTDPVSDSADGKTDPAHPDTNPDTNKAPKLKLSKKQQDIRNFCSIPRNRQEILQRAGVSDHFYNRQKYIYDLVEAGVLERTIPDKPNDPNQKYRRKQ